jgi:hypothetical protein
MSIQKKSLISSLQSAKKANVVKEDLGAHAATVSPATKSPVRANLVRKATAKNSLVRKGAAKTSLVKKAAIKNSLVKKAASKAHASLSSKVR